MGVAWTSGINLYAAILVLGLLGSTGNITLPATLQILTDPMVITAAGVMYFVEFFTDKMPGVDTGWDTLHTFIRIPAGALLAAAMQDYCRCRIPGCRDSFLYTRPAGSTGHNTGTAKRDGGGYE